LYASKEWGKPLQEACNAFLLDRYAEPVARFHCLCASRSLSARLHEYGRIGTMTEGRTSGVQGGNSTISWSGKAYARLSLVREMVSHASFPQVGSPVLHPLRTD
jgi:hypothetical protein